MSSSYGIEPKVEHYDCVIDLLARAGLLEEAMELIGTMPMEPNPSALGALLGGCRIHGNFELGDLFGCLRNLVDIIFSCEMVLSASRYLLPTLGDIFHQIFVV